MPAPTLQHLLDHQNSLRAYCADRGCDYSKEVDLKALADKLGRRTDLDMLRARMTCPKGHRGATLIVGTYSGIGGFGGYGGKRPGQ